MRILLIIVTCLLFVSCGIKDDPKYQTLKHYKNSIKII